MPDLNTKRNKHLSLEDRQEIQECLEKGMPFKAIARRIGKNPTTVSREVKKHLIVKEAPARYSKVDGTSIEGKQCPALLKTPFVCNPCKKRHSFCAFQKQFYYAKPAHQAYAILLVEAREGIPLNKQAFYEADAIITAGIKKGQRLYHIMETHEIGYSQSSAYRHLHRGYLSVSKLDFPRVVKFKARKQSRPDWVPKVVKEGRRYADFLAFISERGIKSWVEMDTVIGEIGGKVIQTFDFTFCNFMFGLLLENKTAAEVTIKIRALKETLNRGGVPFGDVFPLLLTDNLLSRGLMTRRS